MEWFIKALKNFGDFKTRSRRKEFWMYALFYIIFSIVASGVDRILGFDSGYGGGGPIGGLYALIMIVPSLAVSVRRLHDTGRSGWWVLIGLIPVIGIIVLIFWYAQDGESASNEYGPNPKVSEPEKL